MAELTRNAVDVLPEGRLEEQLAGGRPLRVKLGIDPTTADIHLGHTVVLGKLRGCDVSESDDTPQIIAKLKDQSDSK